MICDLSEDHFNWISFLGTCPPLELLLGHPDIEFYFAADGQTIYLWQAKEITTIILGCYSLDCAEATWSALHNIKPYSPLRCDYIATIGCNTPVRKTLCK